MTSPRTFTLDDPEYPAALRSLPQPPDVLHVLGRVELLERPGIAVVGTRQHSTYGRDAAVSFVVGLVRAGYTIISGLARGIDSIAHRTALDVGGDTIGVLGTGIDVPYPPEHEELIRAVAERGCLVTEFPDGTPPLKYHFPQRNRIIAGLARAVLVVEAPEKSGAMITAEYALEEGKEVFAVPGPIHNPTSFGTNRLIQDGAALVTSAADVLRVMGSRTDEPLPEQLGRVDVDDPAFRLQQEPDPAASALARRVWDALEEGTSDLDTLTAVVGSAPGALASALLELELSGLVQKSPGPRYRRSPAALPVSANKPG
jgi:DNA processing protein